MVSYFTTSLLIIHILAEVVKTETVENMIQTLKDCKTFANVEYTSFCGQNRLEGALSRQVRISTSSVVHE